MIQGTDLGFNLTDITSITVAGVSCTPVVFTSSSYIECTTGASATAASNSVTVESETFGSSNTNIQFHYLCNPGYFQYNTGCFACVDGTYSTTEGASNCTYCPDGFGCDDTSATVCSRGTYSGYGQGSCSTCSTGTYNTADGLSTCQTCPVGSACNTTHAIECEPGSFSIGSQTTCTPCVAPAYVDTAGSNGCNTCPPGHACNATTATECEIGTFSVGSQTSCTPCSPGEYNTAKRLSSCQDCPPGFECTTSAATPCSPGSFSIGGQETCTACTIGEYQSSSGAIACLSCPRDHECTLSTASLCAAGETSAEGSDSCTPCSEGTYRPGGFINGCVDCPSGSFASSTGAAMCEVCSAGYFCPNSTSEVICPAGTYSDAGSISCTACPSGRYSSAGATFCEMCPRGKSCFSPSTAPVDCDEGYFSAGGSVSNCTLCEPGTISSATKDRCTNCPAGYECSDPTAGAVQCSAGSWSSGGVVVACQTCPAGYECPLGGPSPPTACAYGTYATLGSDTCTPCPTGFSCANPASSPVACDSGYYSPSGIHICSPCPAGYECWDATVNPVACDSGEYSLHGSANCTSCPAGYHCPTTSASPALCPNGFYSAAGATECLECPAGKDCSSPEIDPVDCPVGTYSPAGAIMCLACPPGFECGAVTAMPVACAAGTYSVGYQDACTSCPAGSYCPHVDSATVHACPSGTYSVGDAVSCTVCPPGKACPDTTAATENDCDPGFYSKGGLSTCIECPAGWECPDLDGSSNARCTPGTYAIAGETSCTTCPAGSACPYTNQAVENVCLPGSYSLGGDASCHVCPPGFACPSTTAVPSSCSAGRYAIGNATSCTDCSAGFACTDTHTATETACTAGSYSLGNSSTCTVCPAGFYCADTISEPEACNAGQYSKGGAQSCTSCPAGYQCADQGNPVICGAGTYSTAGQASCSTCDAGYLCPPGSTSATQVDWECPRGSYCPNSVTRTNCPAGTYGIAEGATTQVAGCGDCPVGYYCPSGTVNPIICPKGHYCEASTETATEHPCEAGTYNDLLGGTSSAVCVQCPEGRYCPEASTHANNMCPRGYFCAAGTQDVCWPHSVGCDTNPPTPCPAGTFSGVAVGLTVTGDCQSCPAGAYCPEASVMPTLCPIGRYSAATDATTSGACGLCDTGMACPRAGLTAPPMNCSAGHYCPAGTEFPTDNPCPPGTYTDSTDLISEGQCETCPAGYACGYGTGGRRNPPMDCAPGHYCPAGTISPTENDCPAGTYSAASNLESSDDCIPCPPGEYCVGGQTEPDGDCSLGYYCPQYSSSPTDNACPSGSYAPFTNLTSADDCIGCPPGSICVSPAVSPTLCAAGTYTARMHTGDATQSTCLSCPAGYKCAEGATGPEECGSGYYSGGNTDTCTLCDVGHYCASNTTTTAAMTAARCPAGLFCAAGMDAAPDVQTHACPAGHYCLEATAAPADCSPGTYNPRVAAESQAECVDCPAGHYCVGGEASVTGECDAGHYCGIGSSSATDAACPRGFFRINTRGESLLACAPCLSGHYCNETALTSPVTCPAGSYCVPGATEPTPCPIGTFSNSTNLKDDLDCTLCSPGKYCDTIGLTEPTGDCDAGYYCIEGATSAAPVDDLPRGDICTAGGFCAAGSSQSQACPEGQFNNATGASSAGDCSDCTPGYYCSGSANSFPTGSCDPGYFCTGGSDTPTQFTTPPGYYSLAGASQGEPCLPGSYNAESGQTGCLDCPAGFFCQNQSMTFFENCPIGSFCELETHTPEDCPPGTYGASLNLVNETQCTQCDPGKYCDTYGQSTFTNDCFAGYVCLSGASVGNPTDGITGYECPAGHYCVAGTHTPTPCPMGTYSSATGLQAEAQCIDCTSGHYCNETGLSAPTGECDAGYYCSNAASVPTPLDGVTGNICPKAAYCPVGSPTPLGCEAGTFMNVTGADECHLCTPGNRCPSNTSEPLECEAGGYCPEGTNLTSLLCPIGTYSASTSLYHISQCTPCTSGSYCDEVGMTSPAAICDAGFVCEDGSINAEGGQVSGPASNPCPAGHFCEAGSAQGDPCPIGTYSGSTQNVDVNDCTDCPSGSYCNETGLSAPSGLCSEGFICTSSSITPTPPGDVTGGPCSAGHFCPEGTPLEVPCNAGTYANLTGQSSCTECPEGYFCVAGSTNYVSSPCPAGYYCPESTEFSTQYSCPEGTFSHETLRVAQSDCIDCPSGFYCSGTAQTNYTGPCDAGYYCTGNTIVARPTGTNGDMCPAGSFCPEGSSVTQDCTAGYYCSTPGLGAPTALCDAGYYCVSNAQTSTPTDGVTGDECPAGYYCDSGADSPTACDMGYYNPSTRGTSIASCLSCTAGHYCNETALSSEAGVCFAGYYCPTGTEHPTSICPSGHMCPEGSGAADPCDAGYYQDAAQQDTCKDCPAGYYCENTGSDSFTTCPEGAYCPLNTRFDFEFKCPNGTFGNVTNLQSLDDCLPCSPGYYCQSPINTAPTGECEEGYYCTSGAYSATPTDGETGDICPEGNYCVRGSVQPSACPSGTYAPGEGQTSSASCQACPAGQYCALSGASLAATTKCNPGYICISGADTPTPTDNTTGYKCGPGYYCEKGATSPVLCHEGTYNPDEGQGNCTVCPAGYVCAGRGNTEFEECPVGYYCEEGTHTPSECEPGSYSTSLRLQAAEECNVCPAGQYCDGSTITAPTGNCSAGYFCSGSSSSSIPSGVYPDNGPCPAGYFCPEGTTSPIACNVGTMNPSTGSEVIDDCIPCTAGSYCQTEGLATPTGLCDEGTFCEAGASSPVGETCPAGYECPAGSSYPQGCDGGTYQPNTGEALCVTCPAGYYCHSNASVALPCTELSYCEYGSDYPTLCPNGTYGAAPRLESPDQCSQCPAGLYCVNGNITGECSVGFICISGNDRPDPQIYNASTGGPCPPGHYCEAGALTPTTCPDGRVREAEGGAFDSDCGPCPAGKQCFDGVPIPSDCPIGYYCPFNTAPVPCPVGTYGFEPAGSNLSSCISCPEGYWCDEEGMAAFNGSSCPTKFYCPEGTDHLVECPGGTYNPTTGAKEEDDCLSCPEGYYCNVNSSVPIQCEGGYYCPEFSASMRLCEPGFYCPPNSPDMTSCPAGSYCEAGSSSYTPCPSGAYCPLEAPEAYLCPFGYQTNTSATLRTSVADSCLLCPPGTYGAHDDRTECVECTAGYVCLGGTTSPTPTDESVHNGFLCPAGYYCPEGSSSPVPCDGGFYNPEEGKSNATDCLACPAGSYSSTIGASACKPCGSSAWSEPQSDTCFCNGTFRVYQEYDGKCLCSPGYEYYDESGDVFNGDSALPCQPIVYDICEDSEIRDMNGKCKADSAASCNAACGSNFTGASGGGTYNPDIGVCICSSASNIACDTECQSSAPKMRVLRDRVTITSADTVSVVPLSDIDGFFGDLACDYDDGCEVISVIVSEIGHTAVYNLSATFESAVSALPSSVGPDFEILRGENGEEKRIPTWGTSARRHHPRRGRGGKNRHFRKLAVDDDKLASGYTSPTLCLRQGEGLVFDLSSEGANTHYPVYMKDSILNTNPSFDYGAFRRLGELLEADAAEIDIFGFTFTEEGTYVFADSSNTDKLTFVVVLPRSQSCPTDGKIVGSSDSNLVQLGVFKKKDLNVEPDMLLIVGFIAAFIVVASVIAFYTKLKEGKYKVKNEPGIGAAASSSEFAKLYQKLEEQRSTNQRLFNMQKKDFRSECDKICAETDQLKALLAVKMTGSGSRAFAEAAQRLLLAEISARNSYYRRQSKREGDIVGYLRDLQMLLADPNSDVNEVKKLVRKATLLVTETTESASKERSRRRTLAANVAIIGDDVIAELSKTSFEEARAEERLHAALKNFSESVGAVVTRLQDSQDRFENRRRELVKARNSAVEQLTERHAKNVAQHYFEMAVHVERTLQILDAGGLKLTLSNARETCKEHQNTAREMINSRMEGAEDVGETNTSGVFRGINNELAHALSVYLADTASDLRVVSGGGKGSHQLHHSTFNHSGYHADSTDHQPGMPSASDATAQAEVNFQNDMESLADRAIIRAEQDRADLLENLAMTDNVTTEDMERIDRDLAKKNELLAAVLEKEKAKRDDLRREQLEDDVVDPNDQAALDSAQKEIEDLRQKHLEEEKRLEAQLEQERTEEEEKERERREEALAAIEAKHNRLTEKLNSSAVSSNEDRSAIMKEHQLELSELNSKLSKDENHSQDRLKRLHADVRRKRAQRKAQLRKKQKAELARKKTEAEKVRQKVSDKINSKKEVIPGLEELEAMVSSNTTASVSGSNASIAAEEQAMRTEHNRLLQELEEKRESDLNEVERELGEEERNTIIDMDGRFLEEKTAIEESKRRDFERETAAMKNDEAQMKALIAKHEAELAESTRQMDLEHERQKTKLREQIAARKRKKVREVERSHQETLAKELKQQKQEEKDLVNERAKRKEHEILKEVVTPDKRKNAKDTIERVLRTRQKKEKAVLLRDQWEEMTERVNGALDAVFEDLREARTELIEKRNRKEITEEEFEQQMESLDDASVDPAQVQSDVIDALEMEHARQRAELDENHTQEVKYRYKQFFPDEDFTGPEWQLGKVNLKAILKERQEKRKDEEAQIQAEIQRLKDEEEAFRVEQQEKLKSAMDEYTQKMEEERASAEEELERRLREEHERVLKEKKEMTAKKLDEMGDLSEQQKEEILKEYQNDIDAQRSAQDIELARQKEKFNERLKKKQEQKRKRELKKQQQDMAKKMNEEKERKRKEIEKLEQQKRERAVHLDSVFKDAVSRFMDAGDRRRRVNEHVNLAAAKFKSLRGSSGSGSGGSSESKQPESARSRGGIPRSGSLIGSLHDITGAGAASSSSSSGGHQTGGISTPQPFFEKLDKIEQVLQSLMEAEGVSLEGEGERSLEGEPTLIIDEKETSMDASGTQPVPCEISELRPKQFVLYRFGAHLLSLITKSFDLPTHHIMISKSLPVKFRGFPLDNAYRNSVQYEPKSKTIFLRQERVVDPGEMALVLLHTAAHIKSGEWSDNNKAFKQEFIRSLQVACGEIFFVRCQLSRVESTQPGATVSMSDVEEAFSSSAPKGDVVVQRDSAVEDFMSLQVSGSKSDDYFAEDRLSERLEKYKTFAHSATLRSHLEAIQKDMATELLHREDEVTSDVADVKTEGTKREMRLEATIEKLERKADDLNAELLPLVDSIQELSGTILSLSTHSPSSNELVRARTQLKKFNKRKDILTQRLTEVERRMQERKKELLI